MYNGKGDRTISETADLKRHDMAYYKSLFGSELDSDIHLADDFWGESERLSEG